MIGAKRMILLALLLCSKAVVSQEPLNVRFCIPNADVYPFYSYQAGVPGGSNPDIVKQAFISPSLTHTQLEFVQRPWKRCNIELRDGSVDFVIGSYDEERDEIGVYPNELGIALEDSVFSTAQVCLISREGEQYDRTLQGLAGSNAIVVGVEAGFSQGHPAHMAIDWLVIYNHIVKYQLLEKGRVDAIAQVCGIDDQPILTKAKAVGQKDFITLYPPYLSSPAYVIFSQSFADNHRETAIQIHEALQVLDKTAIYQRFQAQEE